MSWLRKILEFRHFPWSVGALLFLVSCLGLNPFFEPPIVHQPPDLDKILKPLGFKGPKVSNQQDKSAIDQVNATYYFLVASRLESSGFLEDSRIAFERLGQMDPESSYVQTLLGEAQLGSGKIEEGRARIQKAIELDPKNRKARLLFANLLATQKEFQKARETLLELEKEFPNDEEIVLYSVLIDIEERLLERAQARLTQFLKTNTDSALAQFYLGRIFQERGKPKLAIEAYEKALEIRPGFVQAGTYLGFLQEEMGDKEGALKTYLWLADETDDVTFHRKIGQIFLEKENANQALKAFENLERVDKKDLNNRLKIALLLIDQGKPEDAVEKFEEILKESPSSDNVRFYLGALHEDQKNFQQAVNTYQDLSPESDLYIDGLKRRVFLHGKLNQRKEGLGALQEYENKGWTEVEFKKSFYEDIGELHGNLMEMTGAKPDEFLAEIEKSLKEYPDSERLLYIKGALLERRGMEADAEQPMLKILKANPNHAGALNFVGYIWADQNRNLDQAEVFIRKALRIKPKDPFIMDSLGWVLYRKGKFAEAEKVLREALEMQPEEYVIADHLGDVLVKTGRFEEAKKLYELALQAEPTKVSDKKKIEAKLQNFEKLVGSSCEFDRDTFQPKCSGLRAPASVSK